MRKRHLLCCLLVVLAGCDGQGATYVDVSIKDASVERHGSEVTFTGQFRVLDHRVGTFNLKNVRVVVENESGSTLKTIQLGNVPNTKVRHNISANFTDPPHRVLIETGEVNVDARVVLHGVRWQETEGYEYFEYKILEG